jgi:hypothetical protein
LARLRAAWLRVTLGDMEHELTGWWNSNLYDGTIQGPAEEDLIFKPDGTGQYITTNYFPECADFFRWHTPSSGQLTMLGYKRLLADYEGGSIEETTLFQFENISYHIFEHKNPLGMIITALVFDLPDRTTWLYQDYFVAQWGHARKDVVDVDEPNFSPWKKR